MDPDSAGSGGSITYCFKQVGAMVGIFQEIMGIFMSGHGGFGWLDYLLAGVAVRNFGRWFGCFEEAA